MAPRDPRTALLVRILDQAFDARAWHGTTLRGSVRGLSAHDALWRPSPRRHAIWDLVLHAAYWKYITRRRLTGAKRGAFPRPGSNWPRLPPTPTEAAWRADVALLVDQHERLREAVAAFPSSRLETRPPGGKWTFAEQIHGVAAHDVYHAGQIQLLKRLRGRG
jgi:DinB superfamily